MMYMFVWPAKMLREILYLHSFKCPHKVRPRMFKVLSLALELCWLPPEKSFLMCVDYKYL